jgi:hypothetical protein
MEHRGKQYSVVLGIDALWKWVVDGIEGYTKSGKAPSHAAGVKAAQTRDRQGAGAEKEALATS